MKRLQIALLALTAFGAELPAVDARELLEVRHLELGSLHVNAGEDALFYPTAVAVGWDGTLFVADCAHHVIRKVTPEGRMTTLAGAVGEAGARDGPGSHARFTFPYGIAIDVNGDIYVADSGNSAVRKITPDGDVTTFAGVLSESGSTNSTDEDPDGGRLGQPMDVEFDSAGNLYVTDSRFRTIRMVARSGWMTTFAGSPDESGNRDGFGSDAWFGFPFGIAIDGSGNLWVADSQMHTIRRISPDGFVTTPYGVARDPGSADGNEAEARFRRPAGIAIDGRGIIFVVDADSHTVRRIDPVMSNVTTVAGLAGQRGNRDGVGREVRFDYPFGIAARGEGELWVADMLNHAIRIGTEEEFVTGRRRPVGRR